MLEEELGYTYDADGNRLTKTRNGVVSTYSYAAGSRLVGVSTEGELEPRTTDNGGRETALVVDGRQLSLTYDSDDHATRVVEGSATTEFAFDALGRRVGVTTATGSKRFLTTPNAGNGYESPQAITDGSGAVLASYVFAGEMPLAKTTPAGTEYYLADATGSVIGTAGSSGSLVSTIEYDAFGNELSGAAVPNTTHGEFRLHGMWKDPSGLYYVRARVYDSESGRFTSRDSAPGSMEAPETFYPYAFANGNPYVWADPTGRSLASVAAIGAAAVALSALSYALGGFQYVYRRDLHEDERDALKGVFGTSIDLDRISISNGPLPWNVGTTLGSFIRIDSEFFKGGDSSNSVETTYALVHEAAHVWQAQHRGLLSTLVGRLENSSYEVPVKAITDPKQMLRVFAMAGVEQQANIIQFAFTGSNRPDLAMKYSLVLEYVRNPSPLVYEQLLQGSP